MPTLYEDVMQGVKGHFYRLQVQSPKDKNAIRIESIYSLFGGDYAFLVKKIKYAKEGFVEEQRTRTLSFTDLWAMQRLSKSEADEIRSSLELTAQNPPKYIE